MSGTIRSLLQLAVGGVVLVGAVAWLSGACGERIAPGEQAAAGLEAGADAQRAAVEEVRTPVAEWASGTVASAHETTISSKILARIAAIPVRAGSVVAAGDLLVRLESADLAARVKEAEEALRAAQARFDLAQQERERAEKLVAAAVASQQRLDRARSEFRVARADLEAARERVADVGVGLSYAEIRSPVTGRVVDRLAEPGDTAAPGVPLLRVYDPGSLRLEAPVRETLAVRLVPGQTLRVEIGALESDIEGRIDEIVPFAEPGARTLLVKIRLPVDPGLYAGMFGRAEIPAGEARRLLIPGASVSRVGQLEFASVIRPDGTLERRMLTTGRRESDDRIEVLSGLRAGEHVLVPGS